ncbi:MAG: T9SS type A sorting domain-containing protein [Bacteroidetes bacterium]|nr:MAG: T9SS type A sorting domain-containing protein [Bacteroidota bacterium]
MKVLSAIILSVVIPGVVSAQWNPSSSVNTSVCVQPYDQQDARIVTDSKGGAIITWLDFRNDAAQILGDVFVQRIDKNGINKWTVNGVAACADATNQTAPSVVEDGTGGAIIAWNDWRNGTRDIYAQKIDSTGTVKWAVNGVAVVAKASHQQDAKLISDGAGGAIVVWQDSANGLWDIYAQRISSTGSLNWTAAGVPICSAADAQINPRIETDGAGGAVIVWQDKRGGIDYDIYAQHVDATGATTWTANGVAVCTSISTQSNPKIEPDGAGGMIIAWQDKRNGVDYNVYTQRLSAAGIVLWSPNGVAVCTAAASQSAVDMTSEGIAGAIIVWKDLRSGNYDIYAQRVDLTGNLQWAVNGVAISTGPGAQLNPNAVGDGAGGAIIVWQDSSAGSSDIKSQRLSSLGVVQWTVGGVGVGTAADNQTSPKNVSDGSGGSIYAWQDKRNAADFDIYAHHLYSNGSTSGIFEHNNYIRSSVFPNPFSESAEIQVSGIEYQAKGIRLFDVLGQEISPDVTKNDKGFLIKRNNLSIGIYFYEIKTSENIFSTGKFIITD